MVESYDSMALAYSYLGQHDIAVTTLQEALRIAPPVEMRRSEESS